MDVCYLLYQSEVYFPNIPYGVRRDYTKVQYALLLYSVAILLYVQIATFVYAKAMTRLHRHSARPARFVLFSP
jgi:hypothetical protein